MIKKIGFLLTVILSVSLLSRTVVADVITDNGLSYLISQQDSTGKIAGFGGESQWAAIAFAENGVDTSTVKQSTVSLKDFLLSDVPTSGSEATEWERRVLAIVAVGGDPTTFGTVNYVQLFESLVNSNQIGDVAQLNDDIFGLLALIASGSSNSQLKQDTLTFILSHQNSDGGFSWSTNPSFNSSDSNDTAAAIQALQAAKNDGLTNNNLETAITNAKKYLLTLQSPNGGFKYDFSSWSSDPDGSSTAWSLMALNILGLSSSPEAINAKTWLLSQQEPNGGFHWMSGYGSDTSTTSHALIALSGNGWLYKPMGSGVPIVVTPLPSLTPTNPVGATSTPTSVPIPTVAAVCVESRPGIPVITSADISGTDEVTLNWTKAADPVEYYLVAYGTSPDGFEYGNPNVGGSGTTSYTVGSLSPGVTYYFKVRAGSSCLPGNFSNTAIVTINSVANSPTITTTTQAPSSTPAVLGIATQEKNDDDSSIKNKQVLQLGQKSMSTNGGFIGFSLLSLLSAMGYWYFKLKA